MMLHKHYQNFSDFSITNVYFLWLCVCYCISAFLVGLSLFHVSSPSRVQAKWTTSLKHVLFTCGSHEHRVLLETHKASSSLCSEPSSAKRYRTNVTPAFLPLAKACHMTNNNGEGNIIHRWGAGQRISVCWTTMQSTPFAKGIYCYATNHSKT